LKETYFGGSTPAMVDYMLWPWFERFPLLNEKGFILNTDGKHPKLAAWIRTMENDKNVQQIKVPEAVLKKFMDGYVQGKPEYDIE
jgi:pyrimidodiazepine synthase